MKISNNINKINALIDCFKSSKEKNNVVNNLKKLQFNDFFYRWRLTYLYFYSKRRTDQLNKMFLKNSSKDIEVWLKKNVTFSQLDIVEQIKKHEGAVIFVTPHYGPFAAGCLGMTAILRNIRQVNAFYDPPEKNPTTESYKEILSSLGYNFTPIFNDRKGVIRAMRALKSNQALTMMPDVYDINSQSLMVPFMGHLTYAMSGTAFLALKTNALLIHSYVTNRFDGTVEVQMEEPIQTVSTDDDQDDIFKYTAVSMKSLEKQLMKRPEHWMYLPEYSSRLDISINRIIENSVIDEGTKNLAASLGVSI